MLSTILRRLFLEKATKRLSFYEPVILWWLCCLAFTVDTNTSLVAQAR